MGRTRYRIIANSSSLRNLPSNRKQMDIERSKVHEGVSRLLSRIAQSMWTISTNEFSLRAQLSNLFEPPDLDAIYALGHSLGHHGNIILDYANTLNFDVVKTIDDLLAVRLGR